MWRLPFFEKKANLQQTQPILLQEKEMLEQQVREAHNQPDFASVKIDILIWTPCVENHEQGNCYKTCS